MDHRVISYSFVGAWQEVLTEFPIPARSFALELFGVPSETEMRMSEEGVVIERKGPGLQPKVVMSPQKLIVASPDLAQVGDTVERLIGGFVDNGAGENLKISARGLNSVHLVAGLGESAATWMAKRFVQPGLEGVAEASAEDMTFSFEETSPRRRYRVMLQPQVGDQGVIIINVNDHREGGAGFPESSKIRSQHRKSIALLKTSLFPSLGIELGDN